VDAFGRIDIRDRVADVEVFDAADADDITGRRFLELDALESLERQQRRQAQPGLDLAATIVGARAAGAVERPARPPRPHAPSIEELAAHATLLAKLKQPLWLALD